MTYNTNVSECENWLEKQFAKYKGIERGLLIEMAEKAQYSTTTLKAAIQAVGVSIYGVFSDDDGELLYHVWRKR